MAKGKVKSLSCPTLCDPMDCSPPGSSAHRILQAGVLEWVLFLSPRDLPDLGTEPGSPPSQADASPSEPPGKSLWQKPTLKMGQKTANQQEELFPFSGPQEFPVGWRVCFPSLCWLWGTQWTTCPAGPEGTTPGALSSSACRFPHAPGRAGSRSIASLKPSGWQAALPSTPPASGSQLSLGLGWHSLLLTPPPTLLWAWSTCCPCPGPGAVWMPLSSAWGQLRPRC